MNKECLIRLKKRLSSCGGHMSIGTAQAKTSFEDSNDATTMYLVKKSIAEDLAHILFPVLNYKVENIANGFRRISADVLLGDENEFSK